MDRIGGAVADLKVIYIAGPGRSGSTLLGSLLGQPGDFMDVGELWQYWHRRDLPQLTCSCGQVLAACPFWAEVAGRLALGEGELANLRQDFRTLKVLGLYREAKAGDLASSPAARALAELYGAIAAQSGARVIVDSSKMPGFGLLAASLPEVELYVVHLTRDPRSCMNSWRSEKHRAGGAARLGSRQPGMVLRDWNSWNLSTMTLLRRLAGGGRYLRVAYEDFADEPQAVSRRILDFADESSASLPFTGERSVVLDPGHVFAGNPDRMSRGEREISRRDRWREELPRGTRLQAQLLTTPVRQLLGYLP